MMLDSERSATVGNLSAAKRALLEKRLRGEGRGATGPTISARPRPGPLPLSFAQERLWFLHQLAPSSPLYNISIPLRFSGQLHAGTLEEALAAIVARHESLRTSFINEGGTPIQIVNPTAKVELRRAEIETVPPASVMRNSNNCSRPKPAGLLI
jgi:hypothetical protein